MLAFLLKGKALDTTQEKKIAERCTQRAIKRASADFVRAWAEWRVMVNFVRSRASTNQHPGMISARANDGTSNVGRHRTYGKALKPFRFCQWRMLDKPPMAWNSATAEMRWMRYSCWPTRRALSFRVERVTVQFVTLLSPLMPYENVNRLTPRASLYAAWDLSCAVNMGVQEGDNFLLLVSMLLKHGLHLATIPESYTAHVFGIFFQYSY
jgi:hypothetical protein